MSETIYISADFQLDEGIDELAITVDDISMDNIKVKWRGLTFVVDEEVSLEQVMKAVDLLSQQQVEG